MNRTASFRLQQLPPYLFEAIDRLKRKEMAAGREIIDLGIGDPDLPTPSPVVEALQKASAEPRHHRYPPYRGTIEFRQAIAEWCLKRFGVSLDPEREVLVLLGSKEGIAHLPLALINPGDAVLVPNPGYPVYKNGVMFAGGQPIDMPLTRDRHFLPNLDQVEGATRAKLLFLNYPNNPTSATATVDFFSQCVKWGKSHHVMICNDAPYSEIYFETPPPSILSVEGAKDCCIEFHSLSKSFNMTGWRIGFAVGNSEMIGALAQIKENIDSGTPTAIQEAGIAALGLKDFSDQMRGVYRRRRETLISALKQAELQIFPSEATFYLWVAVPEGETSLSFTRHLLERAGIVATPGSGFGGKGEGYIRFSLTSADSLIQKAAERLAHI